MSDRPEILQLFSLDEGRRLGEPAGQSNAINNYLRLVMNLMKVYSRYVFEDSWLLLDWCPEQVRKGCRQRGVGVAQR